MIELVHNIEAEVVHEIADFQRNDDRLIRCNFPQGPPVEMVKMRVRHEHEIDLGQMMQINAGTLQAFDDLEPHRPVRVDEHVHLFGLNQERRVPDPRDANLTAFHFRKERHSLLARTAGEERRNENAGEKIALMPIRSGLQSDPLYRWADAICFALNDVPRALF